MELLKKEYWWIWTLVLLLTQGIGIFFLAALLKVYDKKAWYSNPMYWVIGIWCCVFPAVIMLSVFAIQMIVAVAKKLEVAGDELYASPYTWIICMVVPFLGWMMIPVMEVYLLIMICVQLYRGKGE